MPVFPPPVGTLAAVKVLTVYVKRLSKLQRLTGAGIHESVVALPTHESLWKRELNSLSTGAGR